MIAEFTGSESGATYIIIIIIVIIIIEAPVKINRSDSLCMLVYLLHNIHSQQFTLCSSPAAHGSKEGPDTVLSRAKVSSCPVGRQWEDSDEL